MTLSMEGMRDSEGGLGHQRRTQLLPLGRTERNQQKKRSMVNMGYHWSELTPTIWMESIWMESMLDGSTQFLKIRNRVEVQ